MKCDSLSDALERDLLQVIIYSRSREVARIKVDLRSCQARPADTGQVCDLICCSAASPVPL